MIDKDKNQISFRVSNEIYDKIKKLSISKNKSISFTSKTLLLDSLNLPANSQKTERVLSEITEVKRDLEYLTELLEKKTKERNGKDNSLETLLKIITKKLPEKMKF